MLVADLSRLGISPIWRTGRCIDDLQDLMECGRSSRGRSDISGDGRVRGTGEADSPAKKSSL